MTKEFRATRLALFLEMRQLSPLASEHFFRPRNVGEVPGTAFVGQAGSLKCGAVLRVSLEIEQSTIVDAKFKAAGCSYLVAATSFLMEQVKGKPTGEAAAMAQFPQTAIVDHFGRQVDGDLSCAGIACQALLEAIRAFSNSVRDEWNGDEVLICACFSVSEGRIENEIRTKGLRTIAEVTKACNAGGGCRSCYDLIEDILSQVS